MTHPTAISKLIENLEKMKEDLREEFEELFPKDQEAIDGIRPSVSHRSEALVLWAKWEIILSKAIAQAREEGFIDGAEATGRIAKEEATAVQKAREDEIAKRHKKEYDRGYETGFKDGKNEALLKVQG